MDFKSLVEEFKSFQCGTRAAGNENAELCYTLWAAHQQTPSSCAAQNSVGAEAPNNPFLKEISAIRQDLQEFLSSDAKMVGGAGVPDQMLSARVSTLEDENKRMKADMKELKDVITKLQAVVNNLTKSGGGDSKSVQNNVAPAKPKKADDEIDLFGSDEEEEDEEAAKIREQRLKAYEEKKSKKPGPIAKSSVILDVKPWDDETNMEEMEKLVRGIEMDGLLWGASKFVPVGYGIKKLQIMCVVEDEKVSVEELQEKIESNEDYVQSVDIAAFNKI